MQSVQQCAKYRQEVLHCALTVNAERQKEVEHLIDIILETIYTTSSLIKAQYLHLQRYNRAWAT